MAEVNFMDQKKGTQAPVKPKAEKAKAPTTAPKMSAQAKQKPAKAPNKAPKR